MNPKEKIKQLELYWRKHIAQFKRAHISQKAYCTKHNLVDHQLSYWKKRIHKLDDQAKVNTHFAKIKLQSEAVVSKKMLKFKLPNGISMVLSEIPKIKSSNINHLMPYKKLN